MRPRIGVGVGLGLLVLGALPLTAQTLAGRIAAVPHGTVRMSYAARDGVCGNGKNVSMTRGRAGEWEQDCEPGPVRVAIDVERGAATAVRTYVGGRWRGGDDVTDLGTVSAPEAAAYLLDLAERSTDVRGDLIAAAVFADSAINTPRLLRIARTSSVRKNARRQAVFWLSHEAGEAAVVGLAELAGDEAEDLEVRKQAVFALSQLDQGRGVPTLITVATTDRDPAIRKQAIFWLGQSEDPRALDLFERLLTGEVPRS